MIRSIFITALLVLPVTAGDFLVEDGADHLRFTNGNQIDGKLMSIDPSGIITWSRPDVATPIPFQRSKIRQLVLKNAHPSSVMDDPCHVTLVNGDRIPGRIISGNEENFTLESSVAGTIVLPRDAISMIAPNPFGGRLFYSGPFDDKDWAIISSDSSTFNFQSTLKKGILPKILPGADGENDAAEEPLPSWKHSGASWYSSGGNDAIVLDANMPDRATLRFKLEWRSRPSIAVAFHADLNHPEPKEEKESDEDEGAEDELRRHFKGIKNLARLFGTSYVLNFQTGYIHLQRTYYNEDSEPMADRIRIGNSNMRLPETGEATFEIRCDRTEGTIAVYINNELSAQWDVTDGAERIVPKKLGEEDVYQAHGGSIGFQLQGNPAPVRISDIIIAEWNGMTDSARSMESDQRDITLLTNGTDRFSGKVLSIQNGIVDVHASYGPLKIPLEDIAEIHFARDERRALEEPVDSNITVHLQPVGRISGKPISSDAQRLLIENPLAGKIDLDLAPAVILEFQSGGNFLDDWVEAP